jgi:hypothetical protein
MVTKRSGFIQALLASLKAPGHCQDWGFGAVGIAIFNPILLDNSQAPNAAHKLSGPELGPTQSPALTRALLRSA